MSNGSSRSSIFLSIVIVFLLVAMGVYGFIYRDKLVEFFQKFQKKNEQVEKVTIYNSDPLAEPASSDSRAEIKTETETGKPKLKDIPVETQESAKAEIESMVYENTPGEPAPRSKKSKLEFKNNLPEESYSKPEESRAKLEFKNPIGKTRKNLPKKSKRKLTKTRSGKGKSALLARVNRLERALGIKSNKKLSLEKRIERLEKKLKQ